MKAYKNNHILEAIGDKYERLKNESLLKALATINYLKDCETGFFHGDRNIYNINNCNAIAFVDYEHGEIEFYPIASTDDLGTGYCGGVLKLVFKNGVFKRDNE